jgi:drug/metabolite transporter (DMT)-like permease
MALKAAIIMSLISIAMLVTYGADVMVDGHNAGNVNDNEKTGFLQMNPSVRGSIFGIIPSAMLIISFFITRKEPSQKIGILIIIGGALIIIGTSIILGMQGGDLPNRAVQEFGAVLAVGIIIAILGIIKIRKSFKTTVTM